MRDAVLDELFDHVFWMENSVDQAGYRYLLFVRRSEFVSRVRLAGEACKRNMRRRRYPDALLLLGRRMDMRRTIAIRAAAVKVGKVLSYEPV